ncbi:MAG: [Fe-Fe] hydrogenase large subunit C-terminal domain-containing protein [Eubacteriales bacterium]|nr:[Fe-Fe] hydrogenase large subunit C-terminal domain-containing protein [Eubacteriales bacterium]
MAEWLKLKKSNCKNCYKCIRYCPVKSIRFSGNQAHIIENECILCGQCFVVCPQNAKEIADELEKVKVLLNENEKVIVSLAPSFIANYNGVGIESIRESLKKLGFYDAEETAIGATTVKNEYNRILREEEPDILISSCCHSVNLLIQKFFINVLPYLARTVSPMQAHCMDIKKRFPDAKTVFIGPCLAKKDEADYYGDIVDAVLTFEELSRWFEQENITLEKKVDKTNNSKARLFPTTGGILKTMQERNPNYTYLAIDGTQNCIAALKEIENGNIHKCFIEMSSCVGSCISGPVMENSRSYPVREYMTVTEYAGDKDFDASEFEYVDLIKTIKPIVKKLPIPTDEELRDVLKNMGKTKPEDELNCGSCGYDTCREKAVAIFQGKAEFSMCLPFLKEKAESFSDNIVNNTPNGIIVVNEKFEVQLINNSAKKILNVRSTSDVMGAPVIRILDPTPFVEVYETNKSLFNKPVYLAEYDKYIEQTIIPDRDYHILICMLRDVTDEENSKKRRERISSQTIDVADKVVDKQMRIVQEIASLLGETAAETKIALTKLKETISDE